jgi:serine/threonine protein kinase
MEYCARGSLHHFLKKEQQLSMERAFKFAIETTAALRDLHCFNPPVFHRDMKSLNLLVTKDHRIKIIDFGLARFATKDNMDTMAKVR